MTTPGSNLLQRDVAISGACTPHVLVIDNWDSFTFNLVQALRGLGAAITVRENDRCAASDLEALAPTHVVVSPGPGRPEDAGGTLQVLAAALERLPVLGVCLGHQAIAYLLGGRVVHAGRPVHGKPSQVYHDHRGVFEGLPNPFDAGRYHSLVVDSATLPPCLRVTAYTSEGEVMGIRHRELPVEGVQFHPESVMTPAGVELLRNFLATRPAAVSAR